LTDGEDDLYELDDAFAEDAEPLVSRRRRKKWDDEPGDRSLFEVSQGSEFRNGKECMGIENRESGIRRDEILDARQISCAYCWIRH